MKSLNLFMIFIFSSSLVLANEEDPYALPTTLPTSEEANAATREWNPHQCGTQEEMARKLNFLNDLVICQSAPTLAACAAFMGATGAGSIAAARAARASAAMSTDRPKMCHIGAQYIFEENFFFNNFQFVWSLMVDKAYANRACVRGGEMAAYRARGYLDNSLTHMDRILAEERASMARIFSAQVDPEMASEVFRRAPTTEAGLRAYADEMRVALARTDIEIPGWRDNAAEYVDYMMANRGDEHIATTWNNMRHGVEGRIGDTAWDLERAMGQSYTARIQGDTVARFSEIRDILESRGPSAAPGVLSADSQRRIAAFRAANPDLVPLLDDALESRAVRSTLEHQSQAYRAALREFTAPNSRRALAENPRRIRELMTGLQHFDFDRSSRHERFLVSSSLGNVTTPGQHGRLHNAGLRMNASDWRGPLHGRPSDARRALVASGSTLARRGATLGLATMGVLTGGIATAAEFTLSPTQLGCGEVRSQFSATDERGCGNFIDINHPSTRALITAEPEFAMRELTDHPEMCEVINQIAAEHGPEAYRATCDSGSGFTIVSRGRRGETDFRMRAVYGSSPGQVAQVNLFGQQTMGHGGIKGLRFDASGNLTEALVPVEGGAWLQAMNADPRGAIDFTNPEYYTTLSREAVENHQTTGSIAAREVGEALGLHATHNAMMSEVNACCTGEGAPSPERCSAYGIEGVAPARPATPTDGVETGV